MKQDELGALERQLQHAVHEVASQLLSGAPVIQWDL